MCIQSFTSVFNLVAEVYICEKNDNNNETNMHKKVINPDHSVTICFLV